MDPTVLKVAVGAFIRGLSRIGAVGMAPGSQTIGPPTPFLEEVKPWLPTRLTSTDRGEGDTFSELVIGSVDDPTPLQSVTAAAESLACGVAPERAVNPDTTSRPATNGLLLRPLLEALAPDERELRAEKDVYSHVYPPAPLSPRSIFPVPCTDDIVSGEGELEKARTRLITDLLDGMKRLEPWHERLHLWFELFDGLVMRTAGLVAAVEPDVSLYDHCRTTAALAAALYLFHRDEGTLAVDRIRDTAQKKFLIVAGDFYGIQDFIFSAHGDVRKYRSKLLRGRSFAVSLFSELAADMVCREVGLPFTSVALNAAGKFLVVAPLSDAVVEAVARVEKEINRRLVEISYGETAIGLATTVVSPLDLVSPNFENLLEKIHSAGERKKFNRIDLAAHGGVQSYYLDSFLNDLERPICPLCGKRPSVKEAEGEAYVKDAGSTCAICRDHVFIGANLVKKERLVVSFGSEPGKPNQRRLLAPIFGRYQLFFASSRDVPQAARDDTVCKVWDISFDLEHPETIDGVTKFLNGYVPVFGEADKHIAQRYSGKVGEARHRELMGQVGPGDPKTLGHIALASLNPPTAPDGKARGIEALGILKADVDQLGLLMSCGLPAENMTLSRTATLSRQFDLYFSLYLPHLFRTDDRFKDMYTVFAGGDDLFIIGPWSRMLDLAVELRESFGRYVCGNPEVHFSAGIAVVKPHIPMDRMADASEEALGQSKKLERNRITIFGRTVEWEELEELRRIEETLIRWTRDEWINKAMLYRLNEMTALVAKEKLLVDLSAVPISEMQCTKWRSLLTYTVARNAAKHKRGAERDEIVGEVHRSLAQWLTGHGPGFEIPLWNLLYNIR